MSLCERGICRPLKLSPHTNNKAVATCSDDRQRHRGSRGVRGPTGFRVVSIESTSTTTCTATGEYLVSFSTARQWSRKVFWKIFKSGIGSSSTHRVPEPSAPSSAFRLQPRLSLYRLFRIRSLSLSSVINIEYSFDQSWPILDPSSSFIGHKSWLIL